MRERNEIGVTLLECLLNQRHSVFRILGMVILVALTAVAGASEISFSFASPNYLVSESNGTALIHVLRSGLTNDSASVTFESGDATAQAGLDYVFTSVRLEFGYGETDKTVSIPILNDVLGEGNEYLFLNLLDPSTNASVATPSTAELYIVDDEDIFSFSATNYVIQESNTNAVITVVRVGNPSVSSVVLNYSTTNGTAVPGVNYSNVTGALIFGPIHSQRSFSIPIQDDDSAEGDITISVHLSFASSTSAQLLQSNATVTIIDNDSVQEISRPHLVPSSGAPTTNGFCFQLNGEVGKKYTIEATSNLTNWSPVLTLTNVAVTADIMDGTVTNHPMRFYRAVVRP